jgi:hypothetical protein
MGRATKPARAAALRLALVLMIGAGLAGCSGVSSSLQSLNPFSSSDDMALADGPVSLRQLREAGGERLSEDTIRSSLSGQEFVWQPIGLDASGVIAFNAGGGLAAPCVSNCGGAALFCTSSTPRAAIARPIGRRKNKRTERRTWVLAAVRPWSLRVQRWPFHVGVAG